MKPVTLMLATIAISAFLFAAAPPPATVAAHAPAPPVAIDEWSPAVSGLRGRIVLSLPDAKTKRISVYVEFENVSQSVEKIAIGTHPKLSWNLTAVDPKNGAGPGGGAGGDGGVRDETWATIPYQARCAIPVNAHGGFVSPAAALIAVNQEKWVASGGDVWVRSLAEGTYKLSATVTSVKNPKAPPEQWIGTLELPEITFAVRSPQP